MLSFGIVTFLDSKRTYVNFRTNHSAPDEADVGLSAVLRLANLANADVSRLLMVLRSAGLTAIKRPA